QGLAVGLGGAGEVLGGARPVFYEVGDAELGGNVNCLRRPERRQHIQQDGLRWFGSGVTGLCGCRHGNSSSERHTVGLSAVNGKTQTKEIRLSSPITKGAGAAIQMKNGILAVRETLSQRISEGKTTDLLIPLLG